MTPTQRIGALIRGAICASSPGPLVRYRPSLPGGASAVTIALPADEPEDVDALRSQLGATNLGATDADALPDWLFIEGIGAYRLAWSRDDLARDGGASAMPPTGATGERIVSGRIAVVTGGAQGIGAALAEHLAKAGAWVVIADLQQEAAQGRAERINRDIGRQAVLAIATDVTDEEAVRRLFGQTLEQLGGIDLLVSNAGITISGDLQSLTGEALAQTIAINYHAYFLCVKHAAPIMALQNAANGHYFSDIIQINSKSGLRGSYRNSAYAGSKFGGIGLTESFALELIGDNIKVNAICPGNFFDGPLWSDPHKGLFQQFLHSGKVPGALTTDDVRRYYEAQIPAGRGCTPDDIIKALFYCVEQTYETGQALTVTGGQVMLH